MKLIDILNMISKGELKEGTKIKYNNTIYVCKDGNVFEPQKGWGLLECIYEENLNDELELIEPECKHEWKKYSIGRLGITENHRKCKKCGIDEIEPDHFTDVGKMADKIEELDVKCLSNIFIANDSFNKMVAFSTTLHKINEVINKVNAQTTVLLAQEKEIKDINDQLDY